MKDMGSGPTEIRLRQMRGKNSWFNFKADLNLKGGLRGRVAIEG